MQGQGLPPRTGAIHLKATDVTTAAGTFREVTLAADGQGGLWRYQLKGSSPPPGPLLELAGNANFGSRPMSVVIERLNVHMANLSIQNQGQIQARFSPGLDLPTATLKVNSGTVQVTARVTGNQVSGRLDVKNVPLDILNVKGLTGTIQSQMTLSGSPSAPVLEGEVRLNAVKLKQYAMYAGHHCHDDRLPGRTIENCRQCQGGSRRLESGLERQNPRAVVLESF